MDNTEAPVVMFTNYKRTDGFEVSLTLRGDDLTTVATKLDTAIKAIIVKGGTPVSRQSKGYPPKVVDYVVGRVCPLDGGKLINPPKDSNRPIKCENNKYDFATKTSSGCKFTEWPNSKPGQSLTEIAHKLNQDVEDRNDDSSKYENMTKDMEEEYANF